VRERFRATHRTPQKFEQRLVMAAHTLKTHQMLTTLASIVGKWWGKRDNSAASVGIDICYCASAPSGGVKTTP
jgi:hypothetical protein